MSVGTHPRSALATFVRKSAGSRTGEGPSDKKAGRAAARWLHLGLGHQKRERGIRGYGRDRKNDTLKRDQQGKGGNDRKGPEKQPGNSVQKSTVVGKAR